MKKIIPVVCLFFLPFLGYGQYIGPKAVNKIQTVDELVKDVKELTKAKTIVKTKGYVAEKLSGKYMFKFVDESGDIMVEIRPDDLPPVPFDDKDEVLLIGTMKSLKGEPMLEVSKTIVLQD